MSPNAQSANGCQPCGLYEFERNRYFDGKLLVTRDFQEEQSYLRGKARLHNSQLHGHGTVCGLKLTQHPNAACRHQYVVLNPGLALDCCGNEIVVGDRQVIDLRQHIEALPEFPPDDAAEAITLYVGLRYRECESEPVPALLDDCGCGDADEEFNRTRESYELFVTAEAPEAQASDPITAQLDWQHTLPAIHPEAMVVDRETDRLYVADWDDANQVGSLTLYDTETHRLLTRVALGDRPPTTMSRSPQGNLLFIGVSGNDMPPQVLLVDPAALEADQPQFAVRGAIPLPVAAEVQLVDLATLVLGNGLLVLLSDGSIHRWSSDPLRRAIATAQSNQREISANAISDRVAVTPVAFTQLTPADTTITYTLTITNTGTGTDTISLSLSDNTWDTTLSETEITDLEANASTTVTVTVTVPVGTSQGTQDNATLTLTPASEGTQATRASLTTAAISPVSQILSEATDGEPVNPVAMAQSGDGRWLMVADGNASRLIALNLTQFEPSAPLDNRMRAFDLLPDDIPARLTFSYDDERLYILCAESQRLYRTQVRDRLDQFLPRFRDNERQAFTVLPLVENGAAGAPPNPRPVDLAVSPRDNWVYVLRRLFNEAGEPLDRGEVLTLSVDDINAEAGVIDAASAMAIRQASSSTSTNGAALFQTLAFLGQRLYVVGEAPVSEGISTEASISILLIDEASCGSFIRRTLEDCPTCTSSQEGVIIATLPNYRWNLPLVDPDTAQETDDPDRVNVIDNYGDRPLVPSTNTLRQVIECMLKKGITEGIPGPRGAVGPEGAPGARGPGITDVTVSELPAEDSPTADLEPIADDLEGDQRLRLGIPAGARGEPGIRGPGIIEVVASTLSPGSAATAELQAIAGDPEGDQRLLLGIPRGQDGTSPEPEALTQVTHASWHHDEILNRNTPDDIFADRVQQLFQLDPASLEPNEKGVGLVVEFTNPILTRTLHNRSVLLMVTGIPNADVPFTFRQDIYIPITVEVVAVRDVAETPVTWLVGNTQTSDTFNLIRTVEAIDEEVASAIRIGLDPEAKATWQQIFFNMPIRPDQLMVVLRGDWILDEKGRPLDGNSLYPGVPEGPTAAGINGRPSGNGSPGGDWRSIIHIDISRFG